MFKKMTKTTYMVELCFIGLVKLWPATSLKKNQANSYFSLVFKASFTLYFNIFQGCSCRNNKKQLKLDWLKKLDGTFFKKI